MIKMGTPTFKKINIIQGIDEILGTTILNVYLHRSNYLKIKVVEDYVNMLWQIADIINWKTISEFNYY